MAKASKTKKARCPAGSHRVKKNCVSLKPRCPKGTTRKAHGKCTRSK